MRKVIVLGATGLIGKHLVKQLAGCEHISQIVAVTRRKVTYTDPKIENIVIDFNQLEQHGALFKGDILFSCLGTTKKQVGTRAAQRIVDLDYQLKIAKQASENGVRGYFLVSSSGANTKSNNAYLQMKGELEDKVKRLAFEQIAIFQPSLLLGERDGFRLAEKLGGWVLTALCLLPILKRYRPIYGYQVANKMCQESAKVNTGVQVFTLEQCFPEQA
ncbi:short chain dehydrogenase [Pseudoalteromonas phenolica]|uniref:Short chain dehydrogenase n=1 Tax=Pseudoalteromonas phenolica TaxID=161398 RepID=A0A5S3YZX2_9GAMM|nr:NAD(P)H-binding protein [Pseudoalteromonas phenolica]TMN88081.1 short chain dehydrogenase [Pseudoalteromonas phenolica]TMP83992.1 short chain dehydrogenase [Pseudoalteromonas phenolica]